MSPSSASAAAPLNSSNNNANNKKHNHATGPALPPYSSNSTPLPLSSASTSFSPASAPALRKTVRFQTDAGNHVQRAASTTPAHERPHNSVPSASSPNNGYQSSAGTGYVGRFDANGRVVSGEDEDGHSHGHHEEHSSHEDDDGRVARPTLLQPRVAVVLGLPSLWHLPLFACRSLSVCPAIWWSLGIAIRLLMQLHALALARGGFGEVDSSGGNGSSGLSIHDRSGLSLESRLKLTETALAMIWCGASAYLSFFFTDCLMSRWLLNYTPQATIVRLLAINALNGYLTSWVIYLAGSGGDSRLLLPAWVAIAAILTGLYHGTQGQINIRKETSISISVFSGASFISMVSLLAQLYWDRPEYVDVPVVSLARRVGTETARLAGKLFDIGNITLDL
ncbi:N-glycosylation protein EOS1 [Niveomyces insectorum RCEF 264]|uniref:N-glycosylation protein EOS1 n=1 Tax=Niveomyces insectorum RCEF 264 TaxID=1081102 RepID=A0A167LTL6_9HYPO|nr:N-glycosylation protein EOS1 [Niveomyces insectorum RCEF 264]